MSSICHVEIARKLKSRLNRAELEELVKSKVEAFKDLKDFNFEDNCYLEVKKHVDSLRFYEKKNDKALKREGNHYSSTISDYGSNGMHVDENYQAKGQIEREFVYHCFELNDDLDEAEFMDGDEDEGQSPASHHFILPSKCFDGLWESLIFDQEIKSRLLEYINTSLLFSQKGVSSTLIAWNKVVLLHGPPGTGKTSLCKALAQKAAIHLGKQFRYGQLVEINSHSLFSKWFSESGKLVMKMFDKVHELLEDPQSLVFLLIDEVESLAQCRTSAEAGNEPSDSIRAVNALLTQIDRIKRYPNVVILTTSNIVGSIDVAFVDRADLKIYIGAPPAEIIYEIYASSINELMRVDIINYDCSVSGYLPAQVNESNESDPNVNNLLQLARRSHGMSGRTLRKIPFLTHVNFIRKETCRLETFLDSMAQAIEIEKKETASLCKNKFLQN